MKYKPLYQIDDIVFISDEFGYNPSYKTITIGKIKAIHINRGKGMAIGEDKRGIYYDISGSSLVHLPEKELSLYKGEI